MRWSEAFIALGAALFVFPGKTRARTGIVHLFEWRFDDIAKECEQFLGPYGFQGVQVSPVNEYAIIKDRPWYERYQPFSYRIISRSGDEKGFKEMCSKCSKAGVKIYVDVVLNHMSGVLPTGSKGTGGSVPDTANKSYPHVPYTAKHFHKSCKLKNVFNATEVRNCELFGLHDLDQSQEYVRGKLVNFMNKLVDLGASGFRVDAAKHIWPADLKNITDRVKNLPTGERPLVYQEVAEGGAVTQKEYFDTGLVTEFKYGRELSNCFRGRNSLKWLRNWGEPWGFMKSNKALVFIDNDDTQRNNNDILNYKHAKPYKMAVAFMLSWPYGLPQITSSFDFYTEDQGPPASFNGTIRRVEFNPDMSCSNGWICEHRWRPVYSMVQFANVVKGTQVTDFSSYGNNQISFCRGSKGFVAFNGDSYKMDVKAQTCLPPGSYCDVITGKPQNGRCSGKTVAVAPDGTAKITIDPSENDGVLAFHLQSKIDFESTATIHDDTNSSSGGQHVDPSVVEKLIRLYDKMHREFRKFLCESLKTSC